MEMQDKPLRKLYTSLKSNNYDVPDNYESFERTLTQAGQAGAQSRRALHESLKKNNYDVPDNYDSFYKSLFTPVNSTTSMAIGSEPAKPAPQKPTTSTTTATPQHMVQPTKPAPAQHVRPQQVQKPQGKPMTAAQKAAAIGWAQGLTAQTKANTQRAIQKIKNIGKYQKAQGVYGQTKKGNIEYNPKTGKMEQTYLTPQGEQTTHKATADLASHEFRVQQGFLSRMSDNGLNPDNPEDVAKQRQLDKEHPIRDVLDSVWKEAEGIDKQAQEELRSKASSGFNLSTLAEASNSAGAPLAGHDRNFNDELSYQEKRHKAFDFDKMANTIYNRLPKDYRNDRLREYTAYFSKHPKEAKGKSAVAVAKDALMGQIYNNVYSHAVQERLPKSNLEFLLRKVADQPLISSKAAAEFAASSRTGSHGLEVAERDAMAQFGSQHKAMNIMGTVANMALDPITYVSGGVGGFVGKKALGLAGKAMLGKVAEKATEKAVGKIATDVASRYAAGTLAGRVVQGVAGGAANFATFNTLKGIEEQVATGGVVNPETGKSEGFSVGEILKSTGHGLLLGAATGTLSPIIGNFADKAVKATTSTVGKVALRAGETAVSTLAEGTVFSIPEWISGQGDAFDVWTDNMGMMLGFKASHAIKSAPRVLDALRTDGKRYGFSFKERLNKQMEASPSDAGFTSEELDELRNNGYMDLSMLFRNAQKQKSTSPKSHEVGKEVVDDYENLTPDTFDGYEAMKRLMNDKGVSEATRAKAYYIGRMLPMSTITGYTTDKTEDGDIVVKSMSAQGDVVTSRLFTNEKAAQGEIDKIMRQSELNSVDVGEKYKETASNMLVVETAIKEVAPDADMETVLQNYRKVKSGQEDMPQEIIDQAKAIDVAIERNRDIADANRPEAIRAKLNKETGLDVDATLRKMPKDRTEEEKELVDTYIKSLFPEQEKTEDGQPADVQADTEYKQRIEERQQAYDEGKEAFNVADTEGDNSDTDAIVLRYREAYDEIERVFADDAEMRIAQLEEDPWEVMNDQSLTPEQQDAVAYFVNSKAAMDGLTEAANENSENKRADAEHKIAQRTNKQSGMIHPATLKVDDKQVYIVSGNVTMFPDGSTVDIHHSSESVVVCDAETGELKFISPEQIYKVDEPVDPSMELKAVDEAISAEQQAILGNEAETEVSESEEIPEQEENEQPQPIQQDDDVEEMNLDVQNEGEVNLPHNEDLQPSNETIEDDLPQQPETALQRIPKGENGEPLLEQTDPETAWDGVVEYMEDADDAQEYVESMVAQLTKDVDNAKKAVSKVKPSADMAKFKADKAAARQIQADAEARLDKWLQISNVNKARKQAELNRINAERAEADRIAREKAVAELAEQKRVEAEKKAEQEAIGAHAVNPKIKEKWDTAPKVVGSADIITLPDGSKLRGHYVLTEAGAATASHDVNNAYKPTEGFPIDENGQSVNDRDYERDEDARKISRSIADNYDSRALQSVTVVDNNGITLSGNGRNIAGELAAQQGTDGAYIDYLREFPQKYGLTAEQVQSMQHPRVHFVPDEVLPYDAATFARFNAQEMKSQSKPEAAVKLGKVVPDNTFGNIVRSLAQYDRLSDFYANEKDANGAIMELVKAGVVNDKQLPELRTGDALSAAGRELLENTLIGKVFQSNPDAVRQIIAQPGIKQSIVMALSEIAHNRTLANGYDLSEELSNAVDLVARAKQADHDTYKEGMPVSPFGRQQGLFDDELGDKRVTDATTLLFADILNSTKPSDLRKVLATYNAEGETAANGQLDIFSGDLRDKEEILTDINKHFINATPKEQQALVDAAIAERKRRAAEAAATEQSGGNDTAEQAASVETSSGQPQPVPVETTPIGTTSTPAEIQAQREQTETNPTEAQKEAGNYRKGHIKVDGYDIVLENPKGTTRSGKDANGKEWSITMKHDYGYIRGTKGTDGDHIDVYLSDNPTAGNVYVVDQVNQRTGDFDEHKVVYGFNSMEEAVQAYRDQYEDGWKVGTVTEVSREEFKKWVDSSVRKTKPFAEYKSVKSEMGGGFDTEHTQSGENYAHNSEEIMRKDILSKEESVENQENKSEEEIVSKENVRKAINAYEEAQEKFDNLFSLLVKEKESKPFDSREWREVNRTKEELKDVLLQLNAKELSELLKQVSEKDTEDVIKNVLDIVNRKEHRLIAFNAILDKQSYITPEYKEEKKAIPVLEFVETDKKRAETHTMLTGVFHDKGYVVGTDAYLLLARKEDYDKSLEGKVTNKKGEIINGKYPNWRAVVNSGKQGKSWGVNLEELHAFTRGVLTKLKKEKANPSTKKDAKIAFKTADGKIVLCYANALDKALQGAKSIGAKSFFDNDDVFAITQTTKGYVICPMLNQDQNIDDNSFAYSNLSNIKYEDGNFSELTAEEPLFNVSSSIRSFIEGNLFSEVDFSDSPNKNVNQAISKLTDDELLKEIAKGDSKEWNFYMEEYDRRHNKEFQEAVERYMNSLEDEKTSLDTAYGSYINVAKNWSNGGYHTTERTLLRAQLDAIEDYVSKKESEQLSSVESEAYRQAKETVRKVGYDLTRLRLRPLEEGEACHVERRYTESNGFSFTGKEHIESIEDIAYIFKQLETSSVENSFLVLIKDGTPTVLHLSIGAYATTLAPIEQAIVAADAINPDKVLFVHNHPSGNISASKQDMDVQKKMKEIFGGKVMPAIIINTTSGKFGMFSEDGRLEDGNIPLPDEHNNIPINVYQFSQQVFAKDWNPEFAFRAVSPESIAEYVSSHRLGEHKKMSLIILDQAGHVTGNVFLPWTKLTDVDSHKNIMQIISYVNQMGGRSAILYGNYELGEDTRDTNKSIFKIKTAFSNSALHLMDVINIDDSALDRGAMEEDVEYGKRNLDEEVNEQFNRDLAGLTEENADTKIFNLGSPSSILLSAGVEDKPMKLYGNKVIKKMKKHGFALEELQNLPKAVANPIAVFDNYQRGGNRSILTELRTQQGNFLVSVNIGKDADVDFNIVRSVFGKGDERVVDWINKGLATYINKEKALSFLSHQSAPIAATAANAGQGSPSYISASALNADATYKNELSSAAKIVKDFVNPNIGEEKTSLQGKIDPQDTTPQAKALQAKVLSEKLNTPIRVVSDPEEIAELPSRRQQRAKGWWSAKNDEVVILLPNNADVADVANTAVHEVVGHNGLRKLIGVERFEDFLGEVYEHASKPIRAAIDKAERKLFEAEVDKLTQQKNAEADRMESHKGVFSRAEATVEANKKREQMRREATGEYMADMAGRIGYEGFEKMSAEELTFWGKVKAKVQQFLDKFLRGLKIAKSVRLTDKDVAYILYKSWKNLRNGGKPTIMDAAEDALMRSKAHYDETDVNRFRDGDMGLEETITNMKAEISAANKDDFNAKVEAMKAIGGNLQKLRSAMSRQRSYDISTAKAMTDLAQVLLDKGLLDNLSVYETKRVLSAVRNGVGKEDISGHVQKLMDIMVDNQLHSGANMLGKLFTMRGTRLNDRGIEVQGNLDPQGQILVKTARKYTSFPKEEIDNTLIPDLMSRMGSDDQTIADNAAIEYAGAQIARRYVEEITESKAEEKALRESIKTAKEDKDAGKLDAEAYKQYVNATEEAIRQNKIDRAEAYSSIAAEFGGMLGESAKRAKEWREAEQKRINDIHHNCNSDMEGRITDEHHKDNKVQKLMNNSAIRFLLAPLGTFDQMLRMFGKKNVNGEGYLWNRFMRNWVDATENEYTGYRDDLKELDAKVSEVYGKKMKWADLFTLERKMGKVPVEFWDGGERKQHELTQGNLLYIYMVDKMSDGRMKLRYMGITEQDVQHITEILDPKFKELADWLQEEYLVDKRNKYNEVHKRMFGAPMAAIDNYFPLKILKNALDKEEDVAEDDNAGIVLPGTTTNGIIKRTRNNKPLDVTGADAFNVIADHLQEMEHWAAFAELTRDINTMLSYKRFRNQVMNMSSAYGAGATLWKNFRSVCKMAVGAYRPPIAELDKTAVNVAKGVTAAKVSFRVFTALKQFLSFPAYLPDASLAHLAKDVVNPVSAWNWSMKNLPIFEKRWQSRMAGDPRLMKSDMDWKAWRSRIVEIASMIGMSPNAFVDALTVAMGAHAMYQSRYAKYKRWGFDEATADKRAKQDATILYNSTQQSSEGAFLSPMQVDRSWLSVLLTVFRNSSMSYKRQEYDAWRNEVKLFTPGYRQRAEEFMVKQLQREGLTEEQAKKAAHEELRKGPLHNLARIFVFGFLLQYTWNLGAYLPYLILGDDDDEKKKMTDDALTHALFGSLEGLTSGDVLSQAGNMALQGEGNWATVTKDMPLVSDLSDILKTFPKDNVEALNDCVNLLTQSAVGVNPQSITDAMVAIMDYCGDDAQTSRECALLMARVLNCPQSQLDKIYFDELSASGVEASKMTPSQIAERFARYKRHRSAPLTGWMYSDAAIADKDGKRKETVYKKARENFKAAASKSNKEELEQWKAEYKETAAKLSAIKKLREQDEDEADEQMNALENTPEYDRYLIMKDYNSDMNDITKAWLNSKSPTEREQLTKAMFKVQQEMVNELKTSK